MKIFVTVGNTPFNSLIKAIDEQLVGADYQVICQISDGDYQPINHEFISFTDDIQRYYQESDLVICHAGAGTVFELLESHKRMVVVPNHDRIDDHQLDLSSFLESHNLASVCTQLSGIRDAIENALTSTYSHYNKVPFSGYDEINEFIGVVPSNKVAGLPMNIFANMQDAVSHVVDDEGNVTAGSAIAINPEKVIKAINEPKTKDALLSATIRYADGIGVVKTLARKAKVKVSRIPGCELWEALMERSAQFNIPVYLVGAKEETIVAAKAQLEKQYKTNVIGYHNGYFLASDEDALIEEIASLKPKIVSVALGSPRQELFIEKCKPLCPNTFFMGVGGSYDVYTNKVKRAPEFYRKLNLEWFYRLMNQPSRMFRQSNLLKYLYLELSRKL